METNLAFQGYFNDLFEYSKWLKEQRIKDELFSKYKIFPEK